MLPDELAVIIANPGPDEQRFTVFQNVICSKSLFFDRALNGKFEESKTKEVVLRDVDIETLKAMIHWAYHQELPGQHSRYEDVEGNMAHLARLWLLADQLLMPALQEKILERIFDSLDCYSFKPETVIEIFQNTASGSLLRKIALWDVASCAICDDANDEVTRFAQCFEMLDGFGLEFGQAIAEMMGRSLMYSRRRHFLKYEHIVDAED